MPAAGRWPTTVFRESLTVGATPACSPSTVRRPTTTRSPSWLPTSDTPLPALADSLHAAEDGPTGVVHSDRHREHLLVDNKGSLAGVLDFGDAFVGAVAWDFVLLNWYYASSLHATIPPGPMLSTTASRRPSQSGSTRRPRCRDLLAALGDGQVSASVASPVIQAELRRALLRCDGDSSRRGRSATAVHRRRRRAGA